ncbi:MAG: hypothetical protein ABEJ57_07310 [Halobacteriaceae archaeon]
MADRGQVSTTLLEAAIAAMLIFSITALVVLATEPATTGVREAQLGRYADDLGTLLADGGDTTSLATVLGSRQTFSRYRDRIADRVRAALPATLFYRIETAYGPIGNPRPAGVPTGVATVQTTNGSVTIWVWAS